jgi:hypothetical protein
LCKLKKTLKYKIAALKVRTRLVGFRTFQSYLSLFVRQAHIQSIYYRWRWIWEHAFNMYTDSIMHQLEANIVRTNFLQYERLAIPLICRRVFFKCFVFNKRQAQNLPLKQREVSVCIETPSPWAGSISLYLSRHSSATHLQTSISVLPLPFLRSVLNGTRTQIIMAWAIRNYQREHCVCLYTASLNFCPEQLPDFCDEC